MIGRKLLSF